MYTAFQKDKSSLKYHHRMRISNDGEYLFHFNF